uniref:Uncharacterized protein n=1 Tax=uncultured Nitrospirae bacterium MY3-5B TaxID=798578 RepID=D9MP26_9BACT|nr:hypothetical protein LW3_0120 [uncultured Nitrospirae bacterium MY3-5B]
MRAAPEFTSRFLISPSPSSASSGTETQPAAVIARYEAHHCGQFSAQIATVAPVATPEPLRRPAMEIDLLNVSPYVYVRQLTP